MKYYVSTLDSCEDIKERQDSFLGYPTSGVTKTYSLVYSIEDSSYYTVLVSNDFYTELTVDEMDRCLDNAPGELAEIK